ncbi:MAG: hypothetical protein NTV63_02415, partial [Candidatus Woesearchaeota archaeon]|nr:hypothetical protein [Candidatus Woesearchaeota archaeon]
MAEAGNYWKREKEEMINSAERMSSKIYELFCELKRNYLFRKTMINELNEIEKGYQEKRFDYFEFQKKSRAITGGKGKDEAVFEYDSYMETLIARINNLNDRVFYAVYKDNSGSRAFEAQEEYADNGNNGQEEIEVESVFPQPDENAQKEEIQEAQTEKKEPVIAEEIIEKNKSEPVVSWGIGKAIAAPFAMIFSAIARIFWLKKRKETRRIKVKPVEFSGMKKKKQEKEYAFSEKGIFSGMLKPFANFRRRIREEEKFIGANNEIPITVELLPEQRNSILETTYLKKEAERIKRIIEKERLYSTYRPTTLAAISNIMVKRISAYLLDSFPDFFKNFYKIIRAANIKMLSNTYINIMVLFTGAAFLLSSIVATIIFFILY